MTNDPMTDNLSAQQGEGAGVPPLPAGIHTVELVIGDSSGILRGKRIPAALWPQLSTKGIALANVVFEWSPCCEIRDDATYSSLVDGVPDIEIVPIVETLREVPWQIGTARVLCAAHEADGSPVVVDPRRALQDVLVRFDRLGLEVKAATEFEFYLLDAETRQPPAAGTQCYGIAHAGPYERALAPIRNLIGAYGIQVEACSVEYAPGQAEISLRYTDALGAADAAVQFRAAVKEIAAQHGFLATFAAKPFEEESGSGMHIHQSLWRDGANVFSDGGRLSELGRHYLGGLQRHMADLTLFGSPTANGMKRRVDYSFCPTTASWGGDNRTVGLRVIEGDGTAVRIEQRDGAADCNPYLAMAAQLAAGLDGIEGEIEPGPRCEDDGYAMEGVARLPRTIPDAIVAMRCSELAAKTFDPALLKSFAGFCQFEHDAVVNRVSEFERNRYMDAF